MNIKMISTLTMKYKVFFLLALAAFPSCNAVCSKDHLRRGPKGPCNPDICLPEGDCIDYWWCEREAIKPGDHKGTANGTWTHNCCDTEKGPDNLYWNPEGTNGTGTCDYWDNLTTAQRQKYNDDETCIKPHCEFRPDPKNECSGIFWYFDPDLNNGNCVQYECPSVASKGKLLWDQTTKSCHPCNQVFRKDKTKCC